MKLQVPKFSWKLGGLFALLIVGFIVVALTAGINDAGYRTIIQYPNGTIVAKMSPGWYLKFFGSSVEYKDVITMDFDTAPDSTASLDQDGIPVRYSDGGTGTVFGKARFALPSDPDTMIKVHKEFRSNEGLANKLIKSVVQEANNLTAALMTSEEGYAERRAEFTQLAKSQITDGVFETQLEAKLVKDEATGESVYRKVPVVRLNDKTNQPIHQPSDLKPYGINLIGYQMNSPMFEDATMKQIQDKRKATMAIITAKANAEKAKQDAITAEEQGKANVMTAKYEKEVEKEKAVVDAQRVKEVAVIAAAQRVEVAKQEKLKKEQDKLAAAEYKDEQILIGEGDAERKRLVLEADNALEQKLNTYEKVMAKFAEEFGKQKWTPEIVFGGGDGNGGGDRVNQMIDMLTTKTAIDLALDNKIEAEKKQ